MAKIRKQEALDYHSQGKPGKIEVIPTKPYSTQRDLSLAYSPGVAEPCLAIEKDPETVYDYTAKGNLVAVISNGTAVLGLGDIGPEASKPVMEGKGLLFKIFADIDVFDIEVDATDIDKFVDTVKAIAPTFGGINLEDIKAPECFEIEQRLRDELDIPIMHDDQHGTAIITASGLLNALELSGKEIDKIKIVVNGAGASAISCAKLYLALGATKENITMVDSKGVIKMSRGNLTSEKEIFANDAVKADTLEDAIKGADMFLGLSRAGVLSKDMVKSMAPNPIVFALANPDPEIPYEDAISVREDLIMATGRSDHPNQVNNVLGFPFIFRGALDVRATCINEEMKLAAVHAIASLAKEIVPEEVNKAYGTKNFVYGTEYIIPKPMDPRLITVVAPAVAQAAMDSGVAKRPIEDMGNYKRALSSRMGIDSSLMQQLSFRAKQNKKKVVFAEGDNYNVLKAAMLVKDEGIADPVLLGNTDLIMKLVEEYQLDFTEDDIIDPRNSNTLSMRNDFAQQFFEMRNRRGMTLKEAKNRMRNRNYFASMMIKNGDVDALITGVTRKYSSSITPALQIIPRAKNVSKIAGMYVILTKDGPLFFSDITINENPSAQDLVDITVLTYKSVKQFNVKPKIALLSYSNFGSSTNEEALKVRDAVKILHKDHPEIIVDGELQGNFALNADLRNDSFPFSKLGSNSANTLIFPNLSSGNIAYKLIQEITNDDVIGPILLGMDKAVHVLQMGSSVREIANMATLAVVNAQVLENDKK
ncbi:MAG: malate dehydrogenase (oxaloacetate-decarboxylating)(NADP+) [Glaciecola sp.]|jgi:malate dehydrogenase (oxaloacetate-decarboxylating)(NADP+)